MATKIRSTNSSEPRVKAAASITFSRQVHTTAISSFFLSPEPKAREICMEKPVFKPEEKVTSRLYTAPVAPMAARALSPRT